MQEAFNLNEAHLDALVAAVGVEAALKGALLSTLFAIYDAAPSEEAALHTIAVANKMAAKKISRGSISLRVYGTLMYTILFIVALFVAMPRFMSYLTVGLILWIMLVT